MNCLKGSSLPLCNPLLSKHGIPLLSTVPTPRLYFLLRNCQKPRTTLLSGSLNDFALRRRNRSNLLLLPPRAATAGDGSSSSSSTNDNPTDFRDATSSSLEISKPPAAPSAVLANASSSPSTPDEPSTSSTTEQQQKQKQQQQQQQQQSQMKKSSSSSSSSPPRRSNESWLSKLASKFKPGTSVRFILNILAFMLLLRIFPMPGVSNSPLSQPDGVVLRISFSEFVKSVRKNEISRVVVDGNHLSYALQPTAQIFAKGALKDVAFDQKKITFETMRPTDWPTPYETMLANGVQISAIEKKGGIFGTLLNYAFIALLLITVLNRFQIKFPGGRGGAGTGRRHMSTTQTNKGSLIDDPTKITFEDVAGVDEAKEELQEIVEYLKEPERYTKLGARPPRGVLLVGPPGTGKTLLAKAVAGEANVPFFSISASEFVELYVGMGALRVRELFAQARKESPCIVFVDEIDAIGKGRDGRLRSVGNDEREQTLNQLLTELDGFDTAPDQLVICIAATNRADVLDPALLRPGRFDRRVPVERPDRIGREQILRVHIERKELPLANDVEIPAIASQTAGFTGADLANVVNEAALLAGRQGQTDVRALDFDSAILRSVAGLEKKRSVLKGEEKAVVARHEVGHALVATAVCALVPMTNPVERLSIIPRSGGALGFTYSPPVSEDRVLLFENEIRGQLAMLMGGRAAEAATSASISTGAGDDIRRATDLAHRAVAEYGMSTAVGPLSVAALAAGGDEYSLLMDGGGEVSKSVEKEVRSLCENALAAARDVIELNRELHARISGELEREERLDGVALREVLEKTQVPPSLRKFVLGVGS